ncbi:MAG: hypothetical protein EOL88_06640 [Bacteroidia bacterium]|nr:SH3 domain-containing protein [Bacteroidales bacterium]NCD41755.1 hypothetical protein [Bacteroidia bacterium]
MKKYLILCFVVLFISFQTGAQETPEQLFSLGVEAYSARQYADAMRYFSTIIESGYASGEVYYNMGNTAYKQHNIPLAILYYEKARLLIPGDEDLLFNLELAQSRTVDKIEPLPLLFYERWWNSFLIFLPPGGWAILSLGVFALSAVLFLVYRFISGMTLRKVGFYGFLTGMVFFLLTVVLSVASQQQLTAHKHAIVFAPSATAKSSPADDSIDIFVVHEGTKVEITEHVGEWVRVKLGNGSVGWLKSKAIEVI